MHNYVIEYVYYYNPLHVSSNSVLFIRRSNYAHRTVTYREYYTRCFINTI